MSDAGRKMDVEDVLSSIRRLVSEEARTPPEAEKPRSEDPKTPGDMLQASNETAPDKLVLTPSLRVSEAISPPPIQAEIEQRIADIESLVMSEAVTATHAEIAAAVEVQDTPTPPEAEAPMAVDPDPAPHKEPDLAEAPTPLSETPGQSSSEMMAALHLSMQDFARAEPPLTANSASAPAEDTPDDTPEPEATPAPDDIPQDSFDAEVAEFYDIPPEPAPAAAEEPASPDSPFSADADFDAPKPEFIRSTPDLPPQTPSETAEPDATATAESIVHREPPLTSAQAEPEPEPEPTPKAFAEDPIDFTEGDDTFLDEETLREMVSDMVRSELQGELGDRITRNVRKLVRREIYRALASRDFE